MPVLRRIEPSAVADAGVPGEDPGDFVVDFVVDSEWAPHGSSWHLQYPNESQRRYLVRWKECSKDEDTWEPCSSFFWDKKGRCAQIEKFERRQGAAKADLVKYGIEDAKCTTVVMLALTQKISRKMAGWYSHNKEDKFPNCKFGSDRRDVKFGMDRMRFRKVLATRPASFHRTGTDRYEVLCASDLHDWLAGCVRPAYRKNYYFMC